MGYADLMIWLTILITVSVILTVWQIAKDDVMVWLATEAYMIVWLLTLA